MDGYDEEEEFVDLSDLQAELGANGFSLFKNTAAVSSTSQNNDKANVNLDLNKKRYAADTQITTEDAAGESAKNVAQ